MHQTGLSSPDGGGGSAYGLSSSNRHGFSGYSDTFMGSAAPGNHVNAVSNGLSPQVRPAGSIGSSFTLLCTSGNAK